MFAPVGTKTYTDSRGKYIIVCSTNKNVMQVLWRLENGYSDRKQIARPELFAFKTKKSSMKILHLDKFSLSIVSRMLKKYPDEVMVFVGENYWFTELPQEIQEHADFGGSNQQLLTKMEKEDAESICRLGSK